MTDVLRDNFVEYPKINTIFERDGETHKITEKVCRPEFDLIKYWQVQEKIDGTNIGIGFINDIEGGKVWVQGRTNNANIPSDLFNFVKDKFTVEAFKKNFPTLRAGEKVILYGEGCGAGVQKGGGNYGKEKHFILFDVLVGTWWLTSDNVADVSEKFEISMVPIVMHKGTTPDIIEYVKSMPKSIYAQFKGGDTVMEGVVCKTEPRLFMRDGAPLIWKLKVRDFTGEK